MPTWEELSPTDPTQLTWDSLSATPPAKADQGDLARGFKESFQQLPQMGYGAMAGIGAAAETAFGEGGIATGIKKAGIKGYEEAGAKIAQNAKPSDSWNYSYDQAKDGNFGALVDWLQHGIGYVGGQAVQTLLSGGLGAVGGKFVASTAAKQIAEGMVAKEAAALAATDAGKALAADQLTKMATANVAQKFAVLGQNAAVGANAVGMEGGEIYGDLTATNKDRALTGSEIGKAFAATLGAGALEFVGDKVGLDIMLGKSKLLKPTEFMPGMAGRVARGAVAAAGAAPIEAGTEYAQTLAEEYGKGNDAFSEASLAQARDAAALGALGGTTVGGAGGALHGAKKVAQQPVTAPTGATLQIGNTPDPMISFPDGTVARRSEIESHIASLPADQQVAAKAWAMGMGERSATVDPVQAVMATNSVDDAIAAASAAVDADHSDFADLMRSETRNLQVMQAQLDQERIKQGQLDQVHSQSIETMGRLPDQQIAAASAATDETPTAMQLAMQRAQQKAAAAVVEPVAITPVPAVAQQDQRLIPKSKRNVQDQAPRTNQEATEAAPVEAPAAARPDAGGQPEARSEAGASPLATAWVKPVDQRLVPVSKRKAARTGEVHAEEVTGDKISKEWTAFAEDSGTLNIPRADMPQIKAEHRGAMVNFLNARDIAHRPEEVPAASLKPTQTEFSEAKVEKALGFTGNDRSILVSSDNHVLDGHHQWMAKLKAGEPVKVIRLDAPIKQLLQVVKEFPSAEQAAGAESMPTASAAPANRPKNGATASAPQGKEVSRFNGKFGKGMGRDAARLEASRLNRTGSDKTITYTAEEHNDPKLENPYSVVGRKAKEQTAAKHVEKKQPAASVQRASEAIENVAPSEAKPVTAEPDPVAETKATLEASGITGKERLDIIKDVKAGTLTAEEVKEAYPETGVAFSRGTNRAVPAFDNASGKYNPDLDHFWLKKAAQEINGDGMPDAEYHQAIAEYANSWRVDSLLEGLGWRRRGSSNISSSTYFTKEFGVGEFDTEYGGYDEYKTYEARVTDHDDYHPADDSIEQRFQINFREGTKPWADADIGPDLSTAEALERLKDILPNESTAPDSGGAMAREKVPEAMRRSFNAAFGLPVSDVQRMIDSLTSKHESGPEVRVVETPADLPVKAPNDARGWIGNNTVYIVASTHHSEAGIARTFGHEVVGHFGLWRMLGKEGQRQFERNLQLALKSGNKALKSISETVRSMYVDENGKFNLTPAEEANEIAAFAVERAIDPETGEFNPGFGFLKSVFARVAQFLRDMGINIKFTNTELQGMLVNSMRGLEAGHRLEGGGQSMVAAALGGRDLPDVSNQRTGISTALLHLGQNEDLFQYPRSYSLDPKDIADDKATTDFGRIDVSDVDKATDNNKLWMLSNTTPDDNPAAGVKSWILTTPGGKHATLTKKGREVYINVSGIGENNGGSAIYDLAANYALNNGLVFVGDPNGVSNVAMRRRLENMLSSAIKYGTTDHLQPHPDQYLGNADIGVPPLDWTKGDTLGNIRNMVDVSIEANEHANPGTTRQIDFRPDTQTFVRRDGSLVGDADLSDLLSSEGRSSGSGGGGNTTLRRYALFKSLLQSVGNRTKFLESVYRQQDGGSANPSGALKKSFYARGGIVGQTTRQHTPEQLRAMKNVGFDVEAPTLKERAQALWKDAGKKLAQGIADQFAPVKDLDKNAYAMLRLAKGASGAFEAFLQGGKLKLTDGVYDFDDANKGGVINKLLIPLQGEHHDFMRWVAANRAERLEGEGKENLFSAQDIADLKTLASGTTDFDYTIQTGPAKGRVTRDRTLIYADANRVFNEFNRNVLDMAEQSGLIDGASRQVWEHEFYVPFYRVADEDGGGVRGMSVKGSVLRQQAFKELKGGKNALNSDLLDNTLMNWAHLLDAAAKNRAAKATIEAAERMGVATGGNQSTLASMGGSIHNKNGVVWFMDGGQKRYSLIDNTGEGPYLMTALNALEYAGMRNPVMNAMGAMKHALTVGVTASPFFKIRNLIRDSVQAIGTGNLGYNPAANIAQGWKLTDPKSDAYFRLLAGGGTIHFGTMLEGSEAKRVQALVESGVDDATILNSDQKVKAFYRKYIEPGVSAYNELGNRGEAINRAALYDQLVKQGMNHAEASLQARDLMDFSMQGAFTSVRFLTQVVPFFNARIQGLYKLGKSAKEEPVRFGAVLGAVTMASLGLLAAYGDDDDWKKREEWDRNNFWWFKFGGQAFRIPKPFEIGAIATLAERGFELAFDKEMTNKRFMSQVMTLLGDNLSMNPVPQLVKPMLDVYANKDSFSGRPIESMGMDKLKADYRFTDRTSMTARAISTGMNAVTELAGKESLSPVQVDSMLRGYFGWLGSFVIGAADVLARPATGQAEHPSSDIWKAATGGMTSDLRDAPSRYVSQMYEQAKELEQAYGTWRSLQKEGKTLEAAEFYEDNRDKLGRYRSVEAVKRGEAKFNERIRMIERSNMQPDEKRELIRSIQSQKDRVARLVS